MYTIVTYDGICEWNKNINTFRAVLDSQYSFTLYVKKFENGVVTVDVPIGISLKEFASVIVGCFDEKSNFKQQLAFVFKKPEVEIRAFEFSFNEVEFFVVKANGNVNRIIQRYHEELEIQYVKGQIRREEYMKTREYKIKRAKELKFFTRLEQVANEVLHIDKTTYMKYKDKEAAAKWREFKKTSLDGNPYNESVFVFARRWAKYMQHIMKKHNKTVFEIAAQTKYVCDIDGITLAMFARAVKILSECWKYGSILQRWFYHS